MIQTIYNLIYNLIIIWGPWVAALEFTLLFLFSAFIISQTRKFSYRGVILFCASFLLLLVPVIGKIIVPIVVSLLAPVEAHLIIAVMIGLPLTRSIRNLKKIKIKITDILSEVLENMVVGLLELEKVFHLPKIF